MEAIIAGFTSGSALGRSYPFIQQAKLDFYLDNLAQFCFLQYKTFCKTNQYFGNHHLLLNMEMSSNKTELHSMVT